MAGTAIFSQRSGRRYPPRHAGDRRRVMRDWSRARNRPFAAAAAG